MLLLVWPRIRSFRTFSTLACTDCRGFSFPSPTPNDFFQKTQFLHGTNMLEINHHLRFLIKSSNLTKARQMFDEMPLKDAVTWTNMIYGYINAKDPTEALSLFLKMQVEPWIYVDSFALSLALKACAINGSVNCGECLHGYSVKNNLLESVFVGSALLDMYMKVGEVERGCKVFKEMPIRSVVSWTAVITGLVQAGYSKEGLVCFSQMLGSDVKCDSYILAIALKACAESGALDRGREIHCQTIKKGFHETSFVANSLADMYNKCGKLGYGTCLFQMMGVKDVVSWTMQLSAYAQEGQAENAIRTFIQMRESGVSPNDFTLAAVISSCASLGRVEWGQQLHAHTLRLGLADCLSVANSIITVYSRCGNLALASRVFDGLMRRDIVSWSTIIVGYSQEGYAVEAFQYLSWMRREGSIPNEYALSSLISVCGDIAILDQGKQVHAHVMHAGLELIDSIHCSLIHMYAKCGSIKEASKVFHEAQYEDIVSWTTMIKGYAEHGYCQEAISLFENLSRVGLRPDSVTFISVLTACSHAGLVDLGFTYFNSMSKEYGIYPSKEHYGCLIDMLCRAGRLQDAESMIKGMPVQQDDVVWSALLRASRIHGDFDCGMQAAEEILKLDPNSTGTLVTLINLFAVEGGWKEAADIRKLMRLEGIIKEPGWSWIKGKDQVCAFVSDDRSHPEAANIYTMLQLLASSWPRLSDHES